MGCLKLSYYQQEEATAKNHLFVVGGSYKKSRETKFLYEKDNHLGSVHVVISDRKLAEDTDGDGTIDSYSADVLATYSYYAYGQLQPGRNYNSPDYRFGWQGQEKVDEIKGSGNHYTAEFWEYDPRIGPNGRWNIDPLFKQFPGWSPYSILFNNPIRIIDPTGAGPDDYSVDKSGNIKLEKKTKDNFDVLFAKKDDNTLDKDKSITLDKGILDKGISRTEFKKESDNKTHKYDIDIYKMRGDDKATNLFKFLAINTNVEWSQTSTGIAGKKGLNFLTTSHTAAKERGFTFLYESQLRYGYNLRIHKHSHPSGTGPSKRDRITTKDLMLKHSGFKMQLYIPKYNRLFDYNEFGIILPELKLPKPKAD